MAKSVRQFVQEIDHLIQKWYNYDELSVKIGMFWWDLEEMLACNDDIFRRFDRRRLELRMSVVALSERSGVARTTLVRILAGEAPNASIAHCQRIAEALGFELFVEVKSADEMRREQAIHKAEAMSEITAGTMAMENQQIDAQTVASMTQKTAEFLLHGSGHRLWGK